ncbi:maleylpyruvate isomerase N-terminal domain-containing protein [Streptomyces sp. t39]|uniref:maleylpyruvate isomerase N-terminal domain-containing protein n=1 Tax=Streptomyces sp. t39 TaxID=1828156 RepID=UPI0011CD7882|nr:maleylpyruvate isomerase N-terminal domain-containing protein [Streptomyces sp. t39]TXS44779.1 hypothetical protein EAO77_32855 [Streptomyces sp. t39]
MPHETTAPAQNPVTAADVERAVHLCADLLRSAPADAPWQSPAGGLSWDCRETVEHLADDLFAYAAQLGLRRGPSDREVPFRYASARPGGPANTVFADPEAGAEGLAQVVESCGALLVAMVRTTPPDVRGHHVFGASDAEGFAAMGIVETLVHTHDVAQGLGLAWEPPGELCARVLGRLFPDVPGVPDGGDPWHVLLWATGRGELPGLPRRTAWRWYGEPRA